MVEAIRKGQTNHHGQRGRDASVMNCGKIAEIHTNLSFSIWRSTIENEEFEAAFWLKFHGGAFRSAFALKHWRVDPHFQFDIKDTTTTV